MRVNLDGTITLNKYEHQIMHLIYKFRLLTNEQTMYLIHPEIIGDTFPVNPKNDSVWRKAYHSKYSRVRKELISLCELNFLVSKPYKLSIGRQSTVIYSIHPEKLEFVKEYLEINSDHIGTGWDNDLGDLPEDLFSFPKRIEHHLDSINFYIKLLHNKQQFSFKSDIDYIDNIYAARTYSDAYSEFSKLKPDGELKIYAYRNDTRISKPGIHAWIEIDRSTEAGNILKSKFENYNNYLTYTKNASEQNKTDMANETPSVILTVTNASTRLNRRWSTFFNAYVAQMKEHMALYNMIITNIHSIKDVVDSYSSKHMLTKELITNVTAIAQPNLGFKGQTHLGNTKENITELQQIMFEKLKWLPHFTITENEPTKKQLYLYLKLDCYESQGICRALDFSKKLSTLPASIHQHEIIPVFYQKQGKPIELPILDALEEHEVALLSKHLTYIVDGNEWYAKNSDVPLSQQTSIHPLVYSLHQNN